MTTLLQSSKLTQGTQKFLLLTGLLIMLVMPVMANESQPTAISTSDNFIIPLDDVTTDFVGWCPSNANICRVNREWTVDQLQQQLGAEKWAVWQEDNQLIFAFRGRAASVFVGGGVATELAPVGNGEYWVATIRVRLLDHAVVSYIFGVGQLNSRQFITESYGMWRGKHAVNPPELAWPLQGKHFITSLYSSELDEMRGISVYLPPNYSRERTYPVLYITDGQSTGSFAQVVEPLIQKRRIPPMIIVGVHSAPFEITRDRRSEEYLLGWNEPAYNGHERFFTRTVRRWAELNFGASQDPSERAIMGYSNGAVFAGNTGVRKPKLYGHVMMFSAGIQPQVTLRTPIDARYYLLAGTMEPTFYSQTMRFYYSLLLLNADAQATQRIAGHDFIMWQEELPNALRWMFASAE